MMPRRRGLSRRSSGIRPGVSRKSRAAGVVFFGLNFFDSQSRRASGALATPVWACCALPGSGRAPVGHWETVLLADAANPPRPTFIATPLHAGGHRSPATVPDDRGLGYDRRRRGGEAAFRFALPCPRFARGYPSAAVSSGRSSPARKTEPV